MSRKRTVAVGIIVFLIGTLLLFPARVAYQWFVPDPVKLSGIDGSIWKGNAREGVVGDVYFTNLAWSFKPFSLFAGQLAFDADVITAAGRISTAAGVGLTGNISLTGFVGSLSLAAIHPALQANRIDGTINISLQKLVLENGWPTKAEGSVDISNLLAGAVGPDSLGNFHADITTEESGIIGLVEDAGAVLDVAGTLRLEGDRSYSLVGSVAANSETPPTISQNLRFLGSPDQDGQRQFRFEGSL